ncbi:extracellular solute-binding protein [Streptosporangium sp. NPDC051023]|uniref:extracellular solute-binding protein n=1 Tax=Streptosporangium sp. NPDC051023 TaxID=3155410 RepID=UPI0034510FB4
MNGPLSRRRLLAAAGILVGGAALGSGARIWDDRRRYGDLPAHKEIFLLTGEEISVGDQRRHFAEAWSRQANLALPGSPPARISVQLVELEGTTDQQFSEIAAAAQTGDHRYDVVNVDVAWMASLISYGYLAPFPEAGLRKVRQADLYEKAWKTTVRSDGGHTTCYGLPFASNVPLLFYRKDLVENPPGTFEEAVKMGQEVLASPKKRGALNDGAVAYVGQFDDYEGLSVNALEAIWSGGGDHITLDANCVAALNHLVGEYRAGHIQGDNEKGSLERFREGGAVFLRNWSYAYHQLVNAPAFKRPGDEGTNLGVVALPWPGVLGGQNLAVTGGSPLRDAAADFVVWMTSAERVGQTFVCGGYGSPWHPSYAHTGRRPGCGTDESDSSGRPLSQKDLDFFIEQTKVSLDKARARPLETWYPEYSRHLRSNLIRAMRGETDLDEKRMCEEFGKLTGATSCA